MVAIFRYSLIHGRSFHNNFCPHRILVNYFHCHKFVVPAFLDMICKIASFFAAAPFFCWPFIQALKQKDMRKSKAEMKRILFSPLSFITFSVGLQKKFYCSETWYKAENIEIGSEDNFGLFSLVMLPAVKHIKCDIYESALLICAS